MDIIGPAHDEDDAVHTIDIWYAARRRVWIVERLNGAGHTVGTPHVTRRRADALACLAHWRRAHREAHLAAPLIPRTAPAKLLR